MNTDKLNITVTKRLAELLALPLLSDADPNETSCALRLPNGRLLVISRQKDKFHIGCFLNGELSKYRPYYKDGEAPPVLHINVAASKTAEQIAADIRRRLLPEYERALAACLQDKRETEELHARKLLALLKVAVPLGLTVQCDEHKGAPFTLKLWRQGSFRLEAETSCDGCIHLDIKYVSPELAGQIAELLAKAPIPEEHAEHAD